MLVSAPITVIERKTNEIAHISPNRSSNRIQHLSIAQTSTNTIDNTIDDEFRSSPNALRSILNNEGIQNPPRKNNV